METKKDTYGPGARGNAPHVYFHCNTVEEAWDRFDRWYARPQNRATANGRLYRRTHEGWVRVDR